MNKQFYLILVMGFMALSSYGQAIIPFADLSDQNRTFFGGSSNSNRSDYQNYPNNYEKALISVEKDIKEIDQALEGARDRSNQESLQRKRSELQAKRELLLEEAGLVEDLNEFY